MTLLESATGLQIFLNETGTEVNINLYQRRIADRFEAMNLASLDHKNVSRLPLELLAVDCPYPLTFADELDFVIRMSMRTRPCTWLSMEQEHGDTSIALLSSNKLMRTAYERKFLLAYVMHDAALLQQLDAYGKTVTPQQINAAAAKAPTVVGAAPLIGPGGTAALSGLAELVVNSPEIAKATIRHLMEPGTIFKIPCRSCD